MGLDQYLNARKYVSASEYAGEKDNEAFAGIVSALEAEPITAGYNGFTPSATVNLSVGYWRKANQIHGWFVNNCADGEDDCRPIYVSREQLTELLDLCQKVKAGGAEVAAELLPPTVGFFFGSNDIDEWYWQDIDSTIDLLTRALADVPEDWDFIYEASW